ncbi:MAG TPA: response regulator, partial [Candidatus Eisenbacteria bacterium]|nr:response regulator [Candidatus Eisenbacteria bacterium]
SASQALEWLRAGENFDLAILDMQMPEMDGLMLAGEIRKLPTASNLPLVLLTSMGIRSDHPDVTKVAFASCLTKPLKPIQLREALVRVVSGSIPATPKPAPTAKLDPKLATRLPLRVLLCDDNPINQKVAMRLLQQMGYRADLAANGVEALAALDERPYDMIFMDVMMPEMGGLEATKKIRDRQQKPSEFPNYKTPIIIVAMTANAMQGDREKCIGAGMDDYLAKPVRLEDIRGVIERWGTKAATVETVTELPEGVVTSSAEKGATPMKNGKSNTNGNGNGSKEDAPVDIERLLEFTDGNPENLRELVTLYLEQTEGQIGQLETAVRSGATQEVRGLAHSCAGASATCGMRRLVPLLRELEKQGFEGKLTNATELCQDAAREFKNIRSFLEAYMTNHGQFAGSA